MIARLHPALSAWGQGDKKGVFIKKLLKFLGNLNRTHSAKIPLLIALVAVIGFSFAACGDGSGGGTSGGGGGGTGGGGGGGGDGPVTPGTTPTATFWAYNEVTDKSYSLTAEMLANNNLCEVWVERGSNVNQATAAAIASEYRSRIYPRITGAFSERINFNDGTSFASTVELAHFIVEEFTGRRNSKLTILLLDIKDGYSTETDPYVAGYFAPRDFFTNEEIMEEYPNLRSNERTMLYMDINPSDLSNLDEFYGTIAHELQHLMNFAADILLVSNERRSSLMDLWINEGLSSAAEYVYSQQHSQQRIDWFNYDPTQLIRRGNNFFVWGNRENTGEGDFRGSEILDDYATVYLFFQWLRLHTGGGTDVYKKITFSEEYNHQAVVDAISGYPDWPSLLEGWMKANYYRSGPNGYGSDTKLNGEVKVNYAPSGQTSLSLFPGEGVYSDASSYTVPSSSAAINYRGLQSGGITTTSGSFSGALLTYNKNTALNGSAASGTTTGVAPANIVASGRFSMPDSLRGPYAISMGDMIRRRGGIERNFDLTVMPSSKLLKGVLIE